MDVFPDTGRAIHSKVRCSLSGRDDVYPVDRFRRPAELMPDGGEASE